MKKGLFATIITSVALAVSLFVYMLVSVIDIPAPLAPTQPEYTPVHANHDVVCRTGDIIDELKGYSIADGNLTLTFAEDVTEETQPVKLNEITGNFEVVKAGEFTAVTTEENGDTNTYKVTCYEKGDGSSESPLVICNAEHLVQFQQDSAVANSGIDYLDFNIELASDIDLAGIDWMPIGNNYQPFTGNFDGKGHNISNMNISVDANNYTKYIALKNPNLSIELGFFGKVASATIKDVNFNNSNILLASDVLAKIINKDYKQVAGFSEGVIGHVAIGTVAGMMTRTTYTSTIENVNVKVENSTIQGFSYNGFPKPETGAETTIPNGIGGVAGVVYESNLSNFEVLSADLFANYQISEGSKVGGVVGFIAGLDRSENIGILDYVLDAANKTKISNGIVEANVTTRYYLTEINETNPFGDRFNAVGLIAAIATNAEISDIIVRNSVISDPVGTVSLVTGPFNNVTRVAGGVAEAITVVEFVKNDGTPIETVGEVADYKTVLQNVSVENVEMNIAGSASGIVHLADNYSEIIDCTVSNVTIKALDAAGVAYAVNEGAKVEYTEATDNKVVVDVNLRGVKSAGIAIYNNGQIIGHVNANANPEVGMYTLVNVTIEGYGADLDVKTTNSNDVFAAGLVGYMYSMTSGNTAKLTNFTVSVAMSKSVNYAGVVHMLGQGTDANITDYYDTLVEYIEVKKMNAVSFTKNVYSTTYKVGGAVTNMYNNAKLKNVSVNVNLNKDLTDDDKINSYGAAIFGGLVAHVQGTLIEINACGVQGYAYMNEGNFWSRKKIAEEGDTQTYHAHYVQIAGGLIGLVATEGFTYVVPVAKNTDDTTIAYTNISTNEVHDLTIIVDGDFEKIVENNPIENTDVFYALRGIGALVGNINNILKNEGEGATLPDGIDLTSNNVANVSISASFEAFTYKIARENSTESYILVGAGGQKAVGMLKEIIFEEALNHEIPYITMTELVGEVYKNTDIVDTTAPEEAA